jgi:hypothetical protein
MLIPRQVTIPHIAHEYGISFSLINLLFSVAGEYELFLTITSDNDLVFSRRALTKFDLLE